MVKRIILAVCLTFGSGFCQLDLNTDSSTCIRSVQQIEIPGVYQPFNPSIVPYSDGYLLSFRVRDKETRAAEQIGLVKLDASFCPKEPHQILDLPFPKTGGVTIQDPRLLWVGKELVMVFNHYKEKKMYVAYLEEYQEGFQARSIESIDDFPGKKEGRIEKNWMPFSYNDQLHFIYSMKRHTIFQYIPGANACRKAASTHSVKKWKWGEYRGSTPCLPFGEYYLTFFHSSKELPSQSSNEQPLRHYFIGAYIFENKKPFRIKGVTTIPITHPSFYSGDLSLPWKPLYAVFPCGYVHTNETIHLVYGRQDAEVWIASIDIKKLFESFKRLK